MTKKEIEARIKEKVDQFNEVAAEIDRLTSLREQLRGQMLLLQELGQQALNEESASLTGKPDVDIVQETVEEAVAGELVE